jgi:hypothetical protein
MCSLHFFNFLLTLILISDLQIPQGSFPFLYKRFILYNLTVPDGLLERGIRQHLVASAVGKQIVGSVMRVNDEEFGQSVVVNITATPAIVEDFVRDSLNSEYWSFETRHTEVRSDLPNQRQFNILQSARKAVRGPNSDPNYDHVSLQEAKSRRSASV